MSPALESRTDVDRYLVARIAARDRVAVESLAALPARELDRLLPGGRVSYQQRVQVAHGLLSRRGIDPDSSEYQAAAAQARDLLTQVDQYGSDHAA